MKKEKVKEEIKEDIGGTVEAVFPVMKPRVGKLDLSFPNEDLNKLVSKVNEIIENL